MWKLEKENEIGATFPEHTFYPWTPAALQFNTLPSGIETTNKPVLHCLTQLSTPCSNVHCFVFSFSYAFINSSAFPHQSSTEVVVLLYAVLDLSIYQIIAFLLHTLISKRIFFCCCSKGIPRQFINRDQSDVKNLRCLVIFVIFCD